MGGTKGRQKKKKAHFSVGLSKCLIPGSEQKQLKSAFFLSKPEPVSPVPPPSARALPPTAPQGHPRSAPRCSGARREPARASTPPGGQRGQLGLSSTGGSAPHRARASPSPVPLKCWDGVPALETSLPLAAGGFFILPHPLRALLRHGGAARRPEDHSQVMVMCEASARGWGGGFGVLGCWGRPLGAGYPGCAPVSLLG